MAPQMNADHRWGMDGGEKRRGAEAQRGKDAELGVSKARHPFRMSNIEQGMSNPEVRGGSHGWEEGGVRNVEWGMRSAEWGVEGAHVLGELSASSEGTHWHVHLRCAGFLETLRVPVLFNTHRGGRADPRGFVLRLPEPGRRMADLSDEELMLMFKYGRVEAFDLLFERYRKPLLNFMAHMVGDRAAAEDVFQEVFVEVVRSAERYQAVARLSTWIYKIATNRCLNHLNSAAHRFRRRSVSLDAGAALAEGLRSDEQGPEEAARERELADILRGVVLRLPPGQRAVFVLRETHGREYHEMAEILDLPLGTVKTHLHRARQTVRSAMRRYLE